MVRVKFYSDQNWNPLSGFTDNSKIFKIWGLSVWGLVDFSWLDSRAGVLVSVTKRGWHLDFKSRRQCKFVIELKRSTWILNIPKESNVSSCKSNWKNRVNELRQKNFGTNVEKFGAEVHRLLPKLLPCRSYSCRSSIAPKNPFILTTLWYYGQF